MKVNFTSNLTNKQTFKGYKNVITEEVFDNTGKGFVLLAAQLNNEGTPDLKVYDEINRLNKKPQTDIITCYYSKFNDKRHVIFLNETPLHIAESLKDLKFNVSSQEYSATEKSTLKTYSLLASLTRRMANNNLCENDAYIGHVFKRTFENLKEILGAEADAREFAYQFLESAVAKNKPIDKAAIKLNAGVQKIMEVFFR